ncbi:MAG: hypothetical protein N3D15_02280 [Syntrophorhabdaceae bacterium]|nr:hypothetical protein [Syntrophorhabdaceae bacterium]
MKICGTCKSIIDMDEITFRSECPSCRSDLHICLNCMFYDPGKSNSCRETRADHVREKDRANYCEYFRFNEKDEKKSGKEEAERLWREIFKKDKKGS